MKSLTSTKINQMKITEPLPDTEQILLLNAINALRCAGQEKIADHIDERLEAITKTPKIAIYVKGGMVSAIRSNIGAELDIEIVDADCQQLDYEEDRWEELQTELEFGNY
jgi:hypothetical protein